ncbi:MAG TPA: DNA mismatch repair endonuclease MutL [Candidatus Dojkabacteria bacterium]|nr:DNA mismatch repair endonuclease MutL [Candidatus Dojkabacteria bacterium]
MEKITLNTLPQDIVNQIAAGEVVERPASVVKELVDNSIDANSTKIQIKIENGGIDLIEVSDNGVGIPQESLDRVFMPHTTSKISSLEDLNTLLTMGFRGEALSTIQSVANVNLISKYIDSDVAGEIVFKSINDFSIKKAARETGTVVSVKNIFGNIPARKKFLKTAQTEYKKILDVLYPYFLIYPNIHFTVVKDSKTVIDLKEIKDSKENTVVKERVDEILKEDFVKRMLKVFYDGSGVKISGLIGHPSDHQKRSNHQYIFVNRRPIWDSGIVRAVLSGYERYIPHGERVPFLLLIDIRPDLIDVNVHPRKEEIRFLNPFRAYSAVEEAVKKALSTTMSYKLESEYKPSTTQTPSLVNTDFQGKRYKSKDISFKQTQSGSVRDSLLFSKEVLDDTSYIKNDSQQDDVNTSFRNIFQIFNKYIVIEFENETLWIVDQHAAAERITFEKLKDSKAIKSEQQNLLVPISIKFSEKEIVVLDELKGFFNDLGFEYLIQKEGIEILSTPVEFVGADFRKLFDEIFELSEDISYISKNIDRLREDILATISCHGSVRSGQSLHREEMIDIYKKLIKCENPYSCPHGRPAVWKLRLSDIDSNFERTY